MKQIVAGNLVLLAGLLATGCHLRDEPHFGEGADHYAAVATQLEAPDVESCSDVDQMMAAAPITIRDGATPDYWDLTLQDAIQAAVANSKVLRDLGGAVIRTPDLIQTTYGPALVESDPNAGVEAALSAFDAYFAAGSGNPTDAMFTNNDRALNNELLGGGTRLLKQELFDIFAMFGKRTMTGGHFTLRHGILYDANNAPSNLFPHAWNTNVEFAARHPLLQGAGVDFNSIVGSNYSGDYRDSGRARPGQYNGVLIARINTDVRLADLEIGLRDLVSNVENSYWDLYFAYRELDAVVAARDASLETWRRVHALYEADRRGGEAEKEAQAREQYFRFEEDVQNALTGRLVDGTRTNNGSRGGTFRGVGGVHVAERRLRLLMGGPVTDRKLIRPADEPTMARVAFDWAESVTESLARRTELRRQKWMVKRRELELVASRNFLLPHLDTYGMYRFRGFGESLIDAKTPGHQRFDNAYQDLTTGDFQEWELGLTLDFPIGFRLGHAGVRNAQLLLARDRAVLEEQERQVIHDLADAVADVDRAYAIAQTAYNGRVAAQQQVSAVQAAYDADKAPLDQVLNAQRRLADDETRYHRALVEYIMAIKNVHFEKGSLLDYSQVYLAEGPWPGKAYYDAARLESRRGRPKDLDYTMHGPNAISQGPVFQETQPVHGGEGEVIEGEMQVVPQEGEYPSGEPVDLPYPTESLDPPMEAPNPLGNEEPEPFGGLREIVNESLSTLMVLPSDDSNAEAARRQVRQANAKARQSAGRIEPTPVAPIAEAIAETNSLGVPANGSIAVDSAASDGTSRKGLTHSVIANQDAAAQAVVTPVSAQSEAGGAFPARIDPTPFESPASQPLSAETRPIPASAAANPLRQSDEAVGVEAGAAPTEPTAAPAQPGNSEASPATPLLAPTLFGPTTDKPAPVQQFLPKPTRLRR